MSKHARHFAAAVIASGAMSTWAREGGAQRPTDLPPPYASRPPLLTRTLPDSITFHVVRLKFMQLLQLLQRGEAVALDGELAGVEWSSGDSVRAVRPACRSVGSTVDALAPHLAVSAGAAGGSRLLPIVAESVQGPTAAMPAIVRAQLVLLLGAGRRFSGSIEITLDQQRMRWQRTAGLLSVLCDGLNQIR